MSKTLKIVLAALFSIILVFSLCACDENSANDNANDTVVDNANDTADTNTDNTENTDDTADTNNTENTENTDTPADTDTSDKAEEVSYIGTWVHKKTDAEPFKMTVVIKEDGTLDWNGQTYFWYKPEAVDAREGAIEIAHEGNIGYGDDAYITEDGKLCIEMDMVIIDTEYDHLIFEKE